MGDGGDDGGRISSGNAGPIQWSSVTTIPERVPLIVKTFGKVAEDQRRKGHVRKANHGDSFCCSNTCDTHALCVQ